MTIASHVEQIFQRYGKSDDSHALHARIIELLVADPRVTPQGLQASLRQQARLFHHCRRYLGDDLVDNIVNEMIERLHLHDRVADGSLSTCRKPTENRSGNVSTATCRRTRRQSLANLASRFPWPSQRPFSVTGKANHFTQSGTLELLDQAIDELQPKLIVEVGAWLGGTTRWLLNRIRHHVISIDTWLGSSEHQVGTAWERREPHHANLLTRLFDTFLANCWEFRDRLIPMRTTSLDGFWQIAQAGLHPEIVLLDGAHDEISVSDELELAHELFPEARLIIDDYNCRTAWLQGLVRAVDQFALAHRLTIVEANQHSCMLVS